MWSTIFEFTFIDTATNGPDPAALGCLLLAEGDALGFAGRISIEVRVGSCPSGEMPLRGHLQLVELVVAHRRSHSRLADERVGSGRALPCPRENWFR
ncbi:MAG: hypothetical protein K0S98_2799 [Propionibacteriaceae bacterium]|nr:hypothetical protein [Propionibacteriaceae bacterium]